MNKVFMNGVHFEGRKSCYPNPCYRSPCYQSPTSPDVGESEVSLKGTMDRLHTPVAIFISYILKAFRNHSMFVIHPIKFLFIFDHLHLQRQHGF
jgi:hypothetical protein